MEICVLNGTQKHIGSFYLVPVPEEVKIPTQGVNV